MTGDQRKVAIGAAGGLLAMTIAMALLFHLIPSPDGLVDAGDRLAYAARWNVVAALPLLVAIASVANRRFSTKAIDPTLGLEDKATLVNGRVAANTLEQFALFAAATLALAPALAADHVQLIAAATIVFVAARVAFWIGYRIHPLYRASGMAATSYLNLGLIAAAIWFNLGAF